MKSRAQSGTLAARERFPVRRRKCQIGIASWNATATGVIGESPAVSVSPGDEIKGTIWDTCGAGTVSCPAPQVISEDVSTGRSTTLGDTPSEGQTFNWAFAGALEVYNLN